MNNNNRGNNNRRRGRGNNRPQGGGQQLNRVDSRARGNAPQMLEKYRKMAQDAHLNGDRVQAEYYLQFADHYFRVIADTRSRQEEQRARSGDRWEGQDSDAEGEDESGDFGNNSGFPSFDQPAQRNREDRSEQPRRDDRGARDEGSRDDRQREARARDDRQRDDRPREDRPREDRPRREPRVREVAVEPEAAAEGEAVLPFEPAENPFVREPRPTRGLRPRREDRRPRGEPAEASGGEEPVGLDPASLPPAISVAREPDASAEPTAEPEVAPAPRRRTRRTKPPVDDAGNLEAVG